MYEWECIHYSSKNRGMSMGRLDILANLCEIEKTWDHVNGLTREKRISLKYAQIHENSK